MSSRKMALDYGEKRIGVALSDPLGYTAKGLCVVYWNGTDMDKPVDRLCSLILENDVDTVIVGLPRRTDGKIGTSEEKAKELAQLIRQKSDVEVIMRDERYTSVIAGRILKEKGKGRNRKSGETDMMAAEIILSDYLRTL